MASNLSIALTIGASVAGAISGISRLKQSIKLLRDESQSVGSKITTLGKASVASFKLASAPVLGLGGAIAGISKPAIAFESAMADVRKVVDFKSPEGFAKLSNDILALTRTLPMTANELATITATGGQLGIAEQDLQSFTTTIAKMSVAFDMAAQDSSDAMAKLANVYSIPISEISNLGDAINELSNSSPAKASDIVSTLGRIGGVSKQFGLTENAAAALSNSFISLGKAPEVAGTAINGMLTKLMTADKGSKAFQGALKSMGISAKDLKSAIEKDAEGALVGFLKQIQELPKQAQMGTLVDLFGLEYADDVAVLAGNVGVLEKSLKTLQETDENGKPTYLGSMEKEFGARAQTTENNLKLLRNSIAEVGITIGSAFLPIINKVVNSLKPVVLAVTDWAKANPALIEQVIKFGGVMVGAWAGFFLLGSAISGTTAAGYAFYKLGSSLFNVIKVSGKVIFGLSKLLIGPLAKGLLFASKAVVFLGRSLLMTPIGLAVTAIAGAAYLIWRNWDWVKSKFATLGQWFSALWNRISGFFQSGINRVGNALANWSPLNLIRQAWGSVTGWLSSIWDTITGSVDTGISNVGNALANWSPLGLISQAWSGATGWLSGIWDMITGSVDTGISNVGNAVANWSPVSLIQQGWSNVLSYFGVEVPSSLTSAGQGMIAGITNGITGMVASARTAILGFGDNVKGWFSEKLNATSFSGFGKNIIDGLTSGLKNAWGQARAKVGELGDSIKSWFAKKLAINSPSRVFAGFGINIVEGLTSGIAKKEPSVNLQVQSLASNLMTNFQDQGRQSVAPIETFLQSQRQINNAHSENLNVHFNPTINVVGNDAGIKGQLQEGLKMSMYEFERMLKRVLDQQGRRAYV